MRRIIALSLLAALAGCAWEPPRHPLAVALAAHPASSCGTWDAGKQRQRARRAGLPVEYVAAACARGWNWTEVKMRARSRGYIAGDCRSATGRRLLYAPCGELEGRSDDRGERP